MSAMTLTDVAAPAKLNLFLHIVGRRADGYHLLQSVFVLIDWADTLHFERRADGRLQRHDLTAPCPPTTCACAPPARCGPPRARRSAPTSASTSRCRGAPAWAAAVRTRPARCSR